MKSFSDYAIVYDITCDNERRKVDKVLKGYGFRVQKSVFECRLTKSDKTKLVEKLMQLNIKSGFIKMYRMVYSSVSSVIGNNNQTSHDDGPVFIV